MNFLWRSARKLLWRRRLQSELEAELAHHRELSLQHGNPVGLGNVTAVKESIYDLRRFNFIENAWRDVLFALRNLRRAPAYTMTAAGSLALGMGMCTAMFTVLNAVVLRPLPYSHPQQLVWITQVLRANSTDEVTFTADYLNWRDSNRSFQKIAAYNKYTSTLTGIPEPVQVQTVKASSALLPLLGVTPLLGRNLPSAADTAGHEQVALISYATWHSRFAADRSIVGKPILLDGEQYIVTGVLPKGFEFPDLEQIDIITGLGKNEAGELARNGVVFTIVRNVIGRLKPDVTKEQARQDLIAIQAHLPLPPWKPTITIKTIPLRDHLFGDAKVTSLVLIAGSLLFLLIASANVANLSLVRLMGRDRELAIRRVLGAARSRIIVQILVESSLLAFLACVPGVVVVWAFRRLLMNLGPYRTSFYGDLPIDWRVAAFATCILLLTIFVFGVLPALRISDFHLGRAIAAGQTSIAGKRHNLRTLSLISAGEIAIVIALSSSAVLMLKSFWNMRYKELGFASQHVIAATINLSSSRYNDRTHEFAFVRQLLERTAAIPGIEGVAPTIASEIPPGEGQATNTIQVEGRPILPSSSRHKALTNSQEINKDYFKILQIPLLAGRFLRESDRSNAVPVVVISNQFARRYFPGESVLGRRLQTGEIPNIWYTIVGVVGDVKTSGPAAPLEPMVYTSYEQSGGGGLRGLGVLIQSALPLSTIAPTFRKIVLELDPEQPIANLQTIEERLNQSVSQPRFTASILFAFSCFGLLLATVGVYGVLACRTRAQQREIAVRQALGAPQRTILTNVLRQAARFVVPGLVAGLALALAGNQLLSSLLFEVKPSDPATLAIVAAAILAVALTASILPAFRASRLDPLISLRQE